MKKKFHPNVGKIWSYRRLLPHCLAGAAWLAYIGQASAAETNAPASLTPQQLFEGGTETYKNWVEVSAGAFMIQGNSAQAQKDRQLRRGAFGGVEDFHYEREVATNTVFSVDGRGLFDQHDYRLGLNLKREELGYVRFNYENFRTWDNGAGGFFPPTGVQYRRSDDALALDRGELSFEAGWTPKDLPQAVFKYRHLYRDGEKGSTSWGAVVPEPGDLALVRGLAPSFYDIDEKRDSVQLDFTHKIKAVDFGLGVRYETGDLNNALKATPGLGEPGERKITDRQDTSYDLLSAHGFAETWLSSKVFVSSGVSFANLDNDFSGSSRIYGDDFDVGYAPNALNGLGYFDLNGGSHKQEYVLNLNLMTIPLQNLTIVPSIRAQREDWDADSSGIGTIGENAEPFSSRSSREALDVRERLDLRYTGVTNWVFYAGGEWTQGDGNLKEQGGLSQIQGNGVSPIDRDSDDSRFFQKYLAGVRWYPTRRATIDVGGYYKDNQYDYNHNLDSTFNGDTGPNPFNRYPAFLVFQGFETYDGNVRLTLRPLSKVTLVSRYEYQWSTVHTKPDPISGFAEVESSRMRSHIIAQNVTYVPWSRLSLQAGFSYVLSTTESPISDVTQAVLDAQNNYWTLNFNSGIVLDSKTDLNLGYFYYLADNFQDNSSVGVPYGAGAEQHGITSTLVRRLTERIRLNLKYGFFHYDSVESGGHNNYQGHLVYSSVQYRF